MSLGGAAPLDFWFLLGLAILAVPVAAIAGLALGVQGRRRIEGLERRIVTLERELARRVAPAAATAAQAASVTPAAAGAEPTQQPAAQPVPPSAPTPEPARVSVPPASAPKPSSPAPGRSLEERLGARWTVIVGGLALALGGVFLVRYSIEQGWIGPAARVVLGALFSVGLLALGERLRRSEAAAGRPRRPIDIPAVVTSAGAVSTFATVYAAYALYGFLSPAIAFAALGGAAVATLLAAALHGPVLGAVGLIGAYAVPLLVSSDEPNVWALVIYLLFPTAAAFTVARLRTWPTLALAAGLAAFLWGALIPFGGISAGPGPLLTFAGSLIALTALMHSGPGADPPAAALPDRICGPLIALYGLLAAVAPAVDGFSPGALGGAGAIFAAMLALGAWAPGLAPVAAAGGLLAGLTAVSFDDGALAAVAETTGFPAPGEVARTAGVGSFLGFAGAMGAIFLFGGAAAARIQPAKPDWRTGLLAASAVAAPLLLLAAAYWRVAEFAPDLRFATVAILLAGAYAVLVEDAARREPSGAASPMAMAAYATGAAAALGLALAMAMREGALTVALAFLAMALGYVAAKRPIRALGWLAIAASGLVLLRVALDPRIVGDDLGPTPIFNALLWGYGAPMVAFWLGSRQFEKAGQPWPAQALEGLALLFALLLGFAQARHFAHGGDMTEESVKLVEAGLDATVAFGLAAIAGRLGLGRASPVLGWGALAAGAIGVLIATLGLLIVANPFWTGEPIGGGLVLNDLILGYLIPAIAAVLAARYAGEDRPVWVRRALGGIALALAFAYLSFSVRRVFGGPLLDETDVSDPEWYAYSVVWLTFGLALLAAGVWRLSQMLRLASAIVIVAVILKVFFIDLAGLGGVWRALSFMGLGGVLVGIGLLYQRLLFPRGAPA